MDCPDCGDAKAYVGFSKIECPNATCVHFSEKLLEALIEDMADEIDEICPEGVFAEMDDEEIDERLKRLYSGIMTRIGLGDLLDEELDD
jgi:hypothetical protein